MAQSSRKLGWDADSAVGLAVGLGCLSRSRSRGRAELKLKQGMARDLQYTLALVAVATLWAQPLSVYAITIYEQLVNSNARWQLNGRG